MSESFTCGQDLFDLIQRTCKYTTPDLGISETATRAPYGPALTPSFTFLPAFIVYEPTLYTLLMARLVEVLNTHFAPQPTFDTTKLLETCHYHTNIVAGDNFQAVDPLRNEGDVVAISIVAIEHIKMIAKLFDLRVTSAEQRALVDQKPDRFICGKNYYKVVMEDKGWKPFDKHAPEIIELAKSAEGKTLHFSSPEKDARGIIYRLATAMTGSEIIKQKQETYWGLLFGGQRGLIFQRIPSAEPSRYGLVCSDFFPTESLFIVLFALLLVPGHTPLLADMAKFALPVPVADLFQGFERMMRKQSASLLKKAEVGIPEEEATGSISGIISRSLWLNIHFALPDYETKILELIRITTPLHPLSSSSPDSPPVLTPPDESAFLFVDKDAPAASLQLPPHIESPPSVPILYVDRYHARGGTGLVFKSDVAGLVVKAIHPGHGRERGRHGTEELEQEARVYDALADLQGSALPGMLGLFRGGGWTILITEDCGTSPTEPDMLSDAQKQTLWEHAASIHGKGVVHGDLELRNVVVSASGNVRIIDLANAEFGHHCRRATCPELLSMSATPELEEARTILDRVSSRDLYKCVDYKVLSWNYKDKLGEYCTPDIIVNAAKIYVPKTFPSP